MKEEKEMKNDGFVRRLKVGIKIRVGSTYYTKIREDGDTALVLVEKKEKKR